MQAIGFWRGGRLEYIEEENHLRVKSSIFGSGTVTTQKTVEKEQFTYFFDFEQEELA